MEKELFESLVSKIGDDSLSPEERLDAFDELERLEKWDFEEMLCEIEAEYTQEKMQALVLETINDFIDRLTKDRLGEYELYAERRRLGLPRTLCKEKFNAAKVKFCDEFIAELTQVLKGFQALPVRAWFQESDLRMFRQFGMRSVVRFDLRKTYKVPSK